YPDKFCNRACFHNSANSSISASLPYGLGAGAAAGFGAGAAALGAAPGALTGAPVVSLASALRSPEWAKKVRVGANSPSLCPTISGTTVERRDQVRITCRWRDSLIAAIFLIRCESTNGPFLTERAIAYLPFLR